MTAGAAPGLIVVGGGGLLAGSIAREAARRQLGCLVLPRSECDITNLGGLHRALDTARSAIASRRELAVTVVNCAAYTAVDRAEVEVEQAWRVNALGAENVARAATDLGLSTLYVSTDFVFGGAGAPVREGASRVPYDELDVPVAVGAYARSKYAGEQLTQRAAPTAQVVRVAGLYGLGGRNFASSLADRLRAFAQDRAAGGAAEAKPLRLDAERRTSPTWAVASARRIIDLAAAGLPGVYHAACIGEPTWHEVALELSALLGVTNPPIVAATTAELAALLPPGGCAPRPSYCPLASRIPELRGVPPMPTWQEALAGYVRLEYGLPGRSEHKQGGGL